MAYTTIDDPTLYFSTTLWSGDGNDNRDIVVDGTGMQPDWLWLKERTSTGWHNVFDSVRGNSKALNTNVNNAESTQASTHKQMNSNGFRIGNDHDVNNSGDTYVAWTWTAGGTASSNTDGNITSSVSVNTTSGISIGTYSSVESNTGKTVGHGLGSKPDMVMVKKTSGTANWVGWHQGLTGGSEEDRLIALNSTNASNVITDYWGSGFNSTTFGLWDLAGDNSGTGDYWFFAFKGIKGFSKFGSYTGNGSTDGTFIYTGFRPAFVMTKRTDGAGDWAMMDNKRPNEFNVVQNYLKAQASDAEQTDDSFNIDILSNGFKLRYNNGNYNASGGSYIYMAFAENPFVTSGGIPTTAR